MRRRLRRSRCACSWRWRSGLGRIGRHAHAIALLQRQAQFEGIDGVQAEAFDEERLLGVDVLGLEILELECRDQQFLDFMFQRLHGSPSNL
jgi:hypothetical protein